MARRPDSGRTAVLGAIRAALGRERLSADARAELEHRLGRHKRSLVPAQGRASAATRLDQFQEKAEAVACTVERLSEAEAVPAAVAAYLREHNLPPALALAPENWLAGLPWEREPLLELQTGASGGAERVSLTPAFAAVAETGTLLMLSGPEHPSTLNFLPEHHIVALKASQVVAAYEDAWARLRKARKKGRGVDLPRTVNMITGPSRTGDIELTIMLGAHGPRGLHILLIDDEAGDGAPE
jgi:L-lactate dehydrogenase complex protein LldG